MALSDRERRLLAEMEAALASDDPRLQSTLAGSDTATLIRKAPGGALLGIALIATGIAILFAALITQTSLLAVILFGASGFVVALAGVLMLLRSLAGKGISAPRTFKSPRSMSARLQERWDRRTFE
jgi:hypothetical protein